MSIKQKYGLTDEGVRNVKLGAIWTAVSNLVVFAGVGALFLAMGAFMDHLTGGAALPDIVPFAVGLIVFAVVLFITEYFAYYYQYGVIYKESGRLRIRLAERLRKLPLSFFGRRDLADLTETIMGDVKTIEHAYSHVLPELYGAYIMLGVAAVGLLAFDWRLAVAALWSAPVALGLLFGARRALQPMMHATRMKGLAISEDIQEALECVREVRATNQEERYLEHIRADIDAAERQAAKSEIACGVCVNGAQIVLRLGIATTILFGSILVLDGSCGFMTLFCFLLVASRIYAPFDFVWICPYTELSPRVERMDAAGQNRYLAARYQMFCKRDAVYLENLAAEKRAEEGEMPPGKMPPYMARITDVSQMLRMVNTRQAQKLYLKIRDLIIQKNDGWFCWEAAPDFSRAEKLTQTPERTDLELTVGELASMVFGEFRICLSEIV